MYLYNYTYYTMSCSTLSLTLPAGGSLWKLFVAASPERSIPSEHTVMHIEQPCESKCDLHLIDYTTAPLLAWPPYTTGYCFPSQQIPLELSLHFQVFFSPYQQQLILR